MTECKHTYSLDKYDYVTKSDIAEQRIKKGWKQLKCKNCGLYAIWKRPTEGAPE